MAPVDGTEDTAGGHVLPGAAPELASEPVSGYIPSAEKVATHSQDIPPVSGTEDASSGIVYLGSPPEAAGDLPDGHLPAVVTEAKPDARWYDMSTPSERLGAGALSVPTEADDGIGNEHRFRLTHVHRIPNGGGAFHETDGPELKLSELLSTARQLIHDHSRERG
jgi:hypothetical protein